MTIDLAIRTITIAALPLIFAITLHEAADAWVADKLGDKTASMLGRVSLNPSKHIDLIGTILLPLIMLLSSGFIIGWAKPIPIDSRNFKNPRGGMALVSLGGLTANLCMALLWAALAKIALLFSLTNEANTTVAQDVIIFIHYTATFGISVNCMLLILNLLPIPPLDGSRIISSLLPEKVASFYEKISPYGIWIFLGLILIGALNSILWPPIQFLTTFIQSIFGLD